MKVQRFRILLFALIAASIAFSCRAADSGESGRYPGSGRYQGSAQDRIALQKTGDAIRAAFARGDVDGIMAYHHPDVIKALTPGQYQIGSEQVRMGLSETLKNFSLQFVESHVDNLFFQGDTAVEESSFAIKGTPKGTGQSFLLRGRAMVVYVRYSKSPTGWASIREIIQPAP